MLASNNTGFLLRTVQMKCLWWLWMCGVMLCHHWIIMNPEYIAQGPFSKCSPVFFLLGMGLNTRETFQRGFHLSSTCLCSLTHSVCSTSFRMMHQHAIHSIYPQPLWYVANRKTLFIGTAEMPFGFIVMSNKTHIRPLVHSVNASHIQSALP